MVTTQESWQRQAWALSGPPLWWRTLAVFLLGLVCFVLLYGPSPLLYDADSYYHLSLARAYAEEGLFDELRWVRFGLLAEHFGDKEFLFHAGLIPFATWLEPSLGGRLALALLGAGALATIGFLSLRAIGGWGMWVPFWLLIGSLELTWRLVRLRPEIASLIVLLLALWCVVQRRYVWLGILSLVYALTYTAIHAYLGIFLLVFLAHAWAFRRWDWRLLAYPVLGALLGLLVHPQFPDNLLVWWYQSVEYFRFKGALDVGNEIEPMRTDIALVVNLGWLLGLAIFWRASEKVSPPRSGEASLTFGVAAMAFAVLYLLMSRFALYAVPLVTLWMLFEMHRQGRRITPWLRLPWRGRMRLGMAWLVWLLVSLPVASYELGRYRHRNDPGPENARVVDRQQFSAALPEAARVANPWRSTPIYMFWAPQGRYLQVLDPVFLAATEPRIHAAQKGLFSGGDPDPVATAAGILDSEFLAVSAATAEPRLIERLFGDPRAEVLHRGINLLFRLRPPETSPFVSDWKVVPADRPLPVSGEEETQGWVEFPSPVESPLAGLAGYLDTSRLVGPDQCLATVHELAVEAMQQRVWEFAPTGPSTIWLDESRLALVQDSPGAVLGRGVLLPVDLAAGEHRVTVLTCPDRQSGRAGFYLLEREGV